jgi:hypothetical protein
VNLTEIILLGIVGLALGYWGGVSLAELHNRFDAWREKRKQTKDYEEFEKGVRKTYKNLYGETMP